MAATATQGPCVGQSHHRVCCHCGATPAQPACPSPHAVSPEEHRRSALRGGDRGLPPGPRAAVTPWGRDISLQHGQMGGDYFSNFSFCDHCGFTYSCKKSSERSGCLLLSFPRGSPSSTLVQRHSWEDADIDTVKIRSISITAGVSRIGLLYPHPLSFIPLPPLNSLQPPMCTYIILSFQEFLIYMYACVCMYIYMGSYSTQS